jgi:hypothetical protein
MPTETAALAIIETITTTDLFKPEVINPLLAKIAGEVRAQRNRVHGEIKLSLVSHGVSIEHSEMLVALLCDDAIPHVSITY